MVPQRKSMGAIIPKQMCHLLFLRHEINNLKDMCDKLFRKSIANLTHNDVALMIITCCNTTGQIMARRILVVK